MQHCTIWERPWPLHTKNTSARTGKAHSMSLCQSNVLHAEHTFVYVTLPRRCEIGVWIDPEDWPTYGDGDSSTTFWLRRWMEHSRSPRARTFPFPSPKIWISMWRALWTNFSTKTPASPKLALPCLQSEMQVSHRQKIIAPSHWSTRCIHLHGSCYSCWDGIRLESSKHADDIDTNLHAPFNFYVLPQLGMLTAPPPLPRTLSGPESMGTTELKPIEMFTDFHVTEIAGLHCRNKNTGQNPGCRQWALAWQMQQSFCGPPQSCGIGRSQYHHHRPLP